MTDEEINKAIAIHLGWKGVVSDPILGVMGLPPAANECDIFHVRNVSWTKDLNAMHGAEQTLTVEEWSDYVEHLPSRWEEAIHASARQRAEAFLKTLGKWEKSK